jgi:hypothetical protein
MSVLFIGQSHVAAVRAAHAARRERGVKCQRTRGLHLLEARFLPDIQVSDGAQQFSPLLAAEIREEIDRYRPRIASLIGGNAHNALALVQHPRPFDFMLPGDDAPPVAGAEPIPLAQVRAALAEAIAPDLVRLRLLRDLIGPFDHVESPPPVRDDAFIQASADAWFHDLGIAARGVAPAALRRRMWRLNSQLFKEAVEALGGRFLPVPADVQDPDGFLRPELAGDATHGNAAYGERLIRLIEELPEGV